MVFGPSTCGRRHCPTQGPHALARTTAPTASSAPSCPSRSTVVRTRTEPGVTSSGTAAGDVSGNRPLLDGALGGRYLTLRAHFEVQRSSTALGLVVRAWPRPSCRHWHSCATPTRASGWCA